MNCSIATATDSLLAHPKPIILVDTCSLLDIVRTAYRSDVKISHLQGAKDILVKVKTNQLVVVATSTVENEFQEHLGHTCTELERYMADLEAKNASLINAIESVGLDYRFSIAGVGGLKTKLSQNLRSIAEQLFVDGMILERDNECSLKAHDRVERNQAPSTKGKSESKDCLIIEHYLKLISDLRSNSFTEKVVFVSSNSADYGKPDALRAPLDVQFAKINIDYCNNFQWALKTTGV